MPAPGAANSHHGVHMRTGIFENDHSRFVPHWRFSLNDVSFVQDRFLQIVVRYGQEAWHSRVEPYGGQGWWFKRSSPTMSCWQGRSFVRCLPRMRTLKL